MPDPGTAGQRGLDAKHTPLRIEAATAEEFAALMRQILRQSGLTAGQVAAYAELPRSTVYNWARSDNARLPRSASQVSAFCKVCRLTAADTDKVLSLWEHLADEQARVRASPVEELGLLLHHVRTLADEARVKTGESQGEGRRPCVWEAAEAADARLRSRLKSWPDESITRILREHYLKLVDEAIDRTTLETPILSEALQRATNRSPARAESGRATTAVVRYKVFIPVPAPPGYDDSALQFTVNGPIVPRMGEKLEFNGPGNLDFSVTVTEVEHVFQIKSEPSGERTTICVTAELGSEYSREHARKLLRPSILREWVSHFEQLELPEHLA